MTRAGQSMIEYLLLIGIAVTVLSVMGPAFKRAVESVVKGTADQIGVQRNAEQDYLDSGSAHMNFTTTAVNAQVLRSVAQVNTATGYLSTTIDQHYNATFTNTLTDMGFSQ